MDKKTILAFLLIGLILIITQTKFYQRLVLPRHEIATTEVPPDSSNLKVDSASVDVVERKTKEIVSSKRAIKEDASEPTSKLRSLFQTGDSLSYEEVIVETDNYIAKINPQGAVVSSWILKKYQYNGKDQVQLIQNDGYGNLGIFFIDNEDTIYSYNSMFIPDKQRIQFTDDKRSDSVRFTLDLGEKRQLLKTFKFYNDEYIIDLKVEIKNLMTQFDIAQYYLSWNSGLAYTEFDYSTTISKEDISNAKASVFQGGSKVELSLPDKPFERRSRSDFSGVIDWAAIRTKYFAMIVLPDKNYTVEPLLSGETSIIYADAKLKDRVKKNYALTLKTIIPPSKENLVSQQFRIYIGPLDYFIIKKYHPSLEKIMNFGGWIIRPFSILVLKSFIFLHSFIPNYGFVLVIFALLIKILTWPLTKKSTASMQRMQTLQPRLSELKEKYGKDPQRLNKETMKLYKEAGVNPFSGCLPTLLQLPLLWAIFIVFRNTIELRDAGFIWWIKDLSEPDTIFRLPFTIPFYGDLVNVLPLVMGITMFLQQKMTMKDPKQKAMVYFMPIFLTLLFNTFPAGLNLYYALFNIFSIVQQKWMPIKEAEKEIPKSKNRTAVKKLKTKFSIYKRK